MVNEWLPGLRPRVLFTTWSKARRLRVDCPSIGKPQANVCAGNRAVGGLNGNVDHVKRVWGIIDVREMRRAQDLRRDDEITGLKCPCDQFDRVAVLERRA